MEGHNTGEIPSSGTSSPANSRWNPTKEQISMLEGLYKQGIRTPSAEQIQQITNRLQAYGQIEGKNVFYWFQNHKARQRQKQKQESIAYFNRYLHKTQPVFRSPCPNVVCSPYYLPQADVAFYQHPKVPTPGGIRRRPRTEKAEKMNTCGGAVAMTHCYDANTMYASGYNNETLVNGWSSDNHQETLPLFPLHPTGILRDGGESSLASSTPGSSESSGTKGASNCQQFIDFFSGQSYCDSN